MLLEASVQDRQHRFFQGLQPSAFSLLENGVPQTLDIVRQEDVERRLPCRVTAAPACPAGWISRRGPRRRLEPTRGLRTGLWSHHSPYGGSGDRSHYFRPTTDEGIRAIRLSGAPAILDSLAADVSQPRDAVERAHRPHHRRI